MRPYRPVLSYQGGKFRIAKWIISFFPKHKVYCESFGGSGSILMQKPKSITEIYNDINSQVYDVFKLLRDKDKALELQRRLEFTPWSRQEYYESQYIDETDDDIEKVRKTIVSAFMGISAASVSRKFSGFQTSICKDKMRLWNTKGWPSYIKCIPLFVERLQSVVLENKHAKDIIQQYDYSSTLHYVDPPYVTSTWNKIDRKAYKKILTDNEHNELLQLLKTIKGYVILSGYDNDLYRDILADWHVEQKETINQKNEKRVESIWISPRTWDALGKQKNLLDIGR